MRVITDGVTPSLHADYKHTTVKQYHKEGRALRTETTINDSWDFESERLANPPAPREIGFSANRRLLGVQRLDHDPISGIPRPAPLYRPRRHRHGTQIPGLRLGRTRSHALLSALLTFRTQFAGFTNRDLRILTAELRGLDPATVSAGNHLRLRRLRSHGLIERRPHSNRYRVTEPGLTAMLLTRVHDRLLPIALAHQADPTPQHPLRKASADLPTSTRRPRRTERTRRMNPGLDSKFRLRRI